MNRILLAFLLAISAGGLSFGDSLTTGAMCGTYPGRVLTELAIHQQAVNQRYRPGYVTQSLSSASASVDVGNIAVIPDDGSLVVPANGFDLDQKSLQFQPQGVGYSVSTVAVNFDNNAVDTGIVLNPSPSTNPSSIGDDGFKEVSIGFDFQFFGRIYNKVLVNSDGNLTFGSGDALSSDRSVARLLAGPPRIAPYFVDLDPSISGRLSYVATGTQFIVTWSQVRDYSSSANGAIETFQVVLTPDGTIQFSYSGIAGREAIVGLSPGGTNGVPNLVDMSTTHGESYVGPLVEAFTAATKLDLAAVAQRFYQSHEDAYDYLVVSTNFDFDLGGAFAYEINVSNNVTGLGQIGTPSVFDYTQQFGSSRLQSIVNYGNLTRYPTDDSKIFFRGVDSALSVLAHEVGHRFLAYTPFDDRSGNTNNTSLLGRSLQHWSFFFNNDASFLEGNRIRDNGNGTFTTTAAVEHYSDFDQYLMGFRAPNEVAPFFYVQSTTLGYSAGSQPAVNVPLSGKRVDVSLDQIVSSNGPRVPNNIIAQKNFTVAFVMVVSKGQTAPTALVLQFDKLRSDFEGVYAKGTSNRATVATALVHGLRLTPSPLGLIAGASTQGKIDLISPVVADTVVSLTSSDSTAVGVPQSFIVPRGATTASFSISARVPGRSLLTASAPGYESSSTVVQVQTGLSATGMSLVAASGDGQRGAAGDTLPLPLRVNLQDVNQIPYPSMTVDFSVSGSGVSLSSPSIQTDSQGNGFTTVSLAPNCSGLLTVNATVRGSSIGTKFGITCGGNLQGSGSAILNAAGYARSSGSFAPGTIVSLFGTDLADTIASAASIPLPFTLFGTGTRISVGGVRAPLFYASPTQINFQIPFEVSSSTASVVVNRNGVDLPPVAINWSAASPGIFTWDSTGTGAGVITHPTTNLPVSADSPAESLEVLQMYATGLGPVSPAVPSGTFSPSVPPARTSLPVSVTVNGIPARVLFSGLTPQLVALYQVNFEVPQGVSGLAQVVLSVNGVPSNAVDIQVK